MPSAPSHYLNDQHVVVVFFLQWSTTHTLTHTHTQLPNPPRSIFFLDLSILSIFPQSDQSTVSYFIFRILYLVDLGCGRGGRGEWRSGLARRLHWGKWNNNNVRITGGICVRDTWYPLSSLYQIGCDGETAAAVVGRGRERKREKMRERGGSQIH